uniref:Heat shock protein beta-7-like n=1 Tax=Cynoglossus semilaevis TaxID=244447 RepID=A0A3P8V7C1_CYNSE
MTSSSRRSSSSYRSSSRYSTSSSYRSEGSLGGSSECLDPLFEPFLDCEDNSSLFGEDSPGGPGCLAPFSRHSRPSYGHTGEVRCLGDSYYISANVSQFEPHDIAVTAFNHHVVIHAQKVLDDGSVSDTFTHRSQFPEDMDPLSVSGTLNADGTLVVSVRRMTAVGGFEPPAVQMYRSEAQL